MNEKGMVKVSFLGDFMCEKPFLKAAKKGKRYSFEGFLNPCKALFAKSDLIIGNLETPVDSTQKWTNGMFVFNSPTAFLEEIKKGGVSFLTTASNHCLDRGFSGLQQTIQALDLLGIQHTGTFSSSQDEPFEVVALPDGTKMAILSYTYGTNYLENREVLNRDQLYSVNSLTPLTRQWEKRGDFGHKSLLTKIKKKIPRGFRIRVNNLIRKNKNVIAYTDTFSQEDLPKGKEAEITQTLKRAKQCADLLVVCPHFGGQFNPVPGAYATRYAQLFSEGGADVVAGSHPHVVQPFESFSTGTKVAYSLGNVSLSLSQPYVLHDDLPECSIMFHLYVCQGKVSRCGFSILVEVEEQGFITLHPLAALYERANEVEKQKLEEKNRRIYSHFSGHQSELVPVQEEYDLL